MHQKFTPIKKFKKTSSRSKSNNCFCLSLTLIIIAVVVVVRLILRHETFGDLSKLFGEHFNRLSEPNMSSSKASTLQKYKEVMQRAKALTLRYRNITSSSSSSNANQVPQQEPAFISNIEVHQPNSDLSDKPTAPPQVKPSPTDATLATISGGDEEKIDIVIGMAQDTDPKNLAVFCSSLRKVSTAEIVVFVNTPTPTRHSEIAKANNVILMPFQVNSLSSEMQQFHPSTIRWPLFYRFFEDPGKRKKYSRVWLIDVRDSFFQDDPFKMLPLGTEGFYAFQGVETMAIRDCGWNGGWVKDCFGNEILAEVGNGRIICSGVSMGDMNSVFKYLTLVDDIIMARGKSSIGRAAKFPRCERNGVDQGIHNVLVHKHLIDHLKVFAQSDGPVANLQAQKARINGGKVFNQRGDLVPVVHQYDRRPDLQKQLFSQFVYWIDTNDAAAEWKAEEACKQFTAQTDVDLFKGTCDLKSQGGATSPSSCCAKCAKVQGCKAFTFYSSVCFLKSCTTSNKASSLPGGVSAFLTPG